MTEAERSAMSTIHMYGLIFSMQGSNEKQKAVLDYGTSILKELEPRGREEATA